MSGKKLKVAVIGVGSIAQIAELPALARIPGVEITAAVARHQESIDRVMARYPIKKGYLSFESFIKEADQIDCGFVLTPKDVHPDHVIPLLDKGIDVFCEKPLSTSIRKATEMVEVAEMNNRILMVGFNRRYAPVYVKAKEVFKNNPPEACFAEKNRPQTEYRASLENAIHMVDLMRWYCGEIEEISSHAIFQDPYYETTLSVSIKFANRKSLGLLLANRSAGQWYEKIELYGNGMTVIADAPDLVKIIDNEKESVIKMTPLAMGWARVEDKMGFQQEVEHFIDCVRNRKEPITSGRDALKTHILMDQILRKAGLPALED